MPRYLTFLLDLSSRADNKAVANSVRYVPDPTGNGGAIRYAGRCLDP